ncbi:MAG: hypothetical protein ACRD82_05125 [Blastocatellia bacterium]
MPPLNLLLLPLLGGFIFVSLWYPTKYYTLRADGYRLIFLSSIGGAIFLFISCIISTFATLIFNLFGLLGAAQKIDTFWHQVVPYENTGRAALAFLIGAVLWYPLNRLKVCQEDLAVERMINHKRDALEALLRYAMGKGRMVLVSVKNGKVYVGFVTSNFNPAYELNSMSLFPALSGYRAEENKEVRFTRDYTAVYQEIRDELLAKFREAFTQMQSENPDMTDDELEGLARRQMEAADQLDNFEIAIPISEVQSVNIFDVDVYERHFNRANLAEAAQNPEAPKLLNA